MPIGTLFPAGEGDYRLAYEPERIAELGAGAPVLGNSLPASANPYSAETTRAYVEGLLPEGMRRLKLARELGVDPGDGYALIAALGRDCVGGVGFLPAGEPPPPAAGEDSIEWLSDEELEELVAAPPARLFDPDRPQRMRFALPGVRHKLSLLRSGRDGRWAWPDLNAPSTHIVKPETGEFPELVANEMFCTSVVGGVGLLVAEAAVEEIAGRPCLVSRRFDREGLGLEARRLHQESFCQALGFQPDAEEGSEEAEGPGFAESSGLLRAIGDGESITYLFAAACCNYILGNGDVHGENFALLHSEEEGQHLAPFYDICSTAVYEDPTHTGLVISENYDDPAFLLEVAQAAEDCDLDWALCQDVAVKVAQRAEKALETVATQAREEGWHAPVIDSIVELAAGRAEGLRYEVG